MQWVFAITVSCASLLTAIDDSSIVAKIGRFVVTERDLLESFEAGPAFVRRAENPLRKHLEYMIYERLLALQAESLGYGHSEFVQERVAALEEDLAVDELYKHDILSQVALSKNEIEENVRKAGINLQYRWIFCPSKDEAGWKQTILAKGIPFDSLYAQQFDTSNTPSDRSAKTTVLKLEFDGADLARRIASLSRGQVSQAIEGPDGYYIFKIDNIWQNPIATQTESIMLKEQAIKLGTMIKADALASQFVRNKMKQANPVIKAEGFNILRAYIAEKGLSRDTRVKWAIPATFMTEAGPQPVSGSAKFLSRPLVTFRGWTLTVRDYARWFDVRQFQLRTHSLSAFNSSVKRTIWKMVQDKLLSEEAYRRGFQMRDTVRHEAQKWEAKLLYLAGRSHLERTIQISNDELRSRYEKQRHHSSENSRAIPSFEKVKDELWIDAYYDRERVLLFRELQRLKAAYRVYVNEEALRRLSADIKMDPGAIDAVFYKPGGTFPRVAFPTIDETWARMQ